MAGRLTGAVIASLGIVMAVPGYARPAPGPEDPAPAGVQASQAEAASQRALLDRYCVTCHNQRLKTGDLTLDTLDLAQVPADAAIWEKAIKKLGVGAMPPAGRPRPDEAATAQFISWLETTIDTAAQASPNPGRPPHHRLNRVEYTNAIHDLLHLKIDAEALLPADTTSFGFDNIADVLSLSPSLLDRYMSAARKISRQAIGEEGLRTEVVKQRVKLLWRQEDRLSNDVPAGSRGGAVFRHYFPTDDEYVIRTFFQQGRSGIKGDAVEEEVEFRVDGELVKRFTFGGWFEETGCFGADMACQEKVHAARQTSGDDPEFDGFRMPIKAGEHLLSFTFRKRNWAMEGGGPSYFPIASSSYAYSENTEPQYGRIEMAIESVDIEGPFGALPTEDTPSRRRIFVCYPATAQDEVPCAREILSTLARRAYRRSVTEADVDGLLDFYAAGRQGKTFGAGIQRALTTILIDPEFLFRIERDLESVAPGGIYQLSDPELASRLSFFLWSTIPDDELLNVAAQGKLREEAVLEQQIQRMLRDPRSHALVENFFGQWLSTRSVKTLAVDQYAFPEFDENLRDAFVRETDLFLDSQLREDRSMFELLTANYTFLNERLARHYGILGILGSHFRRVSLTDGRRAGLLGQGSILMLTSYANRTSPVLRGKWVLDNVLGVPPPPPPANVPPLEEATEATQPASMRERMERHRQNPVCANCHAQIDPPGFALENFDAIGAWRATERGQPIDPSGTFYGSEFSDHVSFREALLTRRDPFAVTVTEKLLTYALGRGTESTDMPAVRQIVREAAASDYRWSALVKAIVKSTPFRMRQAES